MRREPDRNEVEILIPVIHELRQSLDLGTKQFDFVCSGSSDYLAGQSFAFVSGLDAVGAWPPVCESHVEMDGAWALYEAWVKMQMGYADTALVYGFGKPSMGDLPITMALQLDPYVNTPLWPDAISLAALQARLLLDGGLVTEREMAERAVRDRKHAKSNPFAQVKGDFEVAKLLGEPQLVSPLRKHDCAPISDGASAIVLAAGDRARQLVQAAGLDPRHLAHRRAAGPRRARPHALALDGDGGREGRRVGGRAWTWPSCRRRSRTRRSWSSARSASARRRR